MPCLRAGLAAAVCLIRHIASRPADVAARGEAPQFISATGPPTKPLVVVEGAPCTPALSSCLQPSAGATPRLLPGLLVGKWALEDGSSQQMQACA